MGGDGGTKIMPLRSSTKVMDSHESGLVLSPAEVEVVLKGGAYTLCPAEVIGEGGQGVVVKARDASGAAFVAKISDVPRARVRDYNKIIPTLYELSARPASETHLMPIVAYGTAEFQLIDRDERRKLFVEVMPVCQQLVEEGSGLSPARIKAEVIPQLADAVNLLHGRNILHRDIKPSNLFLYQGSIVLGDFGISRVLRGSVDAGYATHIDDLSGTTGFYREVPFDSGLGDWYGYGFTIWTLYNGGRHPCQEFLDNQTFYKIQFQQAAMPEFVPREPGDETLGMLLAGLTEPDSAQQLGADAVAEWLADPADFSWHRLDDQNLFSYTFGGQTYTDTDSLATALVDDWRTAISHLYSHQIEYALEQAREDDLRVALHDIVESDEQTIDDRDLGLARALFLLSHGSLMAWRGKNISMEALQKKLSKTDPSNMDRYLTLLKSGYLSWCFERMLASRGDDPDAVELVRKVRNIEQATSDRPHLACCALQAVLRSKPAGMRDAAQRDIERSVIDPKGLLASAQSVQATDEFLARLAPAFEISTLVSVSKSCAACERDQVPDILLTFADDALDRKDLAREAYRKFGQLAPWIWLAEHAENYAVDESEQGSDAREKLIELGDQIDSTAPVSQLIAWGSQARESGVVLRDLTLRFPVPYLEGWETGAAVRPLTLDAIFCAVCRDEYVPRGFVRELLACTTIPERDAAFGEGGIALVASDFANEADAYGQYLSDRKDASIPENEGAVGRLGGRKGIIHSLIAAACVFAFLVFLTVSYSYKFGELFSFLGEFAIAGTVLAVVIYLVCGAFFAITVVRLLSLLERVNAHESDMREAEGRLAVMQNTIASFGSGSSTEEMTLRDPALDEPLPAMVCSFVAADPAETQTRYDAPIKWCSSLGWRGAVLITGAIASTNYLSAGLGGDLLMGFYGVLTVLCTLVCMLFFSDDSDPASLQSLLSWAIVPIIPPLFAGVLPALFSLAIFLIGLAFIAFILYGWLKSN